MAKKIFFIILLSAVFVVKSSFAQGLEAAGMGIYPQLRCCACSTPFDKCGCPEAKGMKAYVDALLEAGMGKEEIFYKVAKKFSLNAISDEQARQEAENRFIREAGQMRPRIIVGADSFDFGRVSKSRGKISRIFKLYNKGNLPLLIKNIRTSCPCASASLKVDKDKSRYFGTAGAPGNWQMAIKPGGSGDLELTVDLASPHVKTGKMIRDASVISNDPVYPEITVEITADVTD